MRRLLAVLLVAPLLAGCGGDPQEEYCAAVRDHQAELSDIVSGGGPDALLEALDVLRALQDQAPRDIADEWQHVVARLEALQEALDAAGVEPAAYDRDQPPEGLSDEQVDRIDAAARELGSGTTLRALQDLEQQARDVCKTPLTL